MDGCQCCCQFSFPLFNARWKCIKNGATSWWSSSQWCNCTFILIRIGVRSSPKSGASLFKKLVHLYSKIWCIPSTISCILSKIWSSFSSKKSPAIRTPPQFLKNLLKILPSIPAPTLHPYGSFNMWTVQIFHMHAGHLPSLHGDIFLPFFYRILFKSLYLVVIFSLDGSKSHVKIKNKIEIRNVSYDQNEI